MANTKKKTTTTKKKATTKKKSSTSKTKKTTRNSSVSSSKKTTAKKSTTKRSTTKTTKTKSVAKKPNIIIEDKEVTKELPKLKIETKKVEEKTPTTKTFEKIKVETKEVSKNTNEPTRVVETEKFNGVKNIPKQTKTKKKSKASFVSLIKKNSFLKKLYRLKRKIRIYGITSVIPKKYFVVSLFLILFMILLPITIYFFQEPKAQMDLSNIEQIDTLKTLSLNLDKVDDIISSTKAFDTLKNYDRYDFESVFKLNSDYVEDFVIKYSDSKKQLLFILKPTNNNYDNVKNTINDFIKENKITNYITFDYDGYIIYIKAKNKTDEKDYNLEVKSKIMQSTKNVFNLLLDLKKDDIESTLNIPSNLYSEAIIKVARIKTDTCGYAIIKPTSLHAKNRIMTLMNDYYKSLEEKWIDNPTNLELVKNRYFEDYDGYLIYIISNNNKLVMDLLKSK